MGKARDPNRDIAKKMWQDAGGRTTIRKIAERIGVDERKLSMWKKRDDWDGVLQSNKKPTKSTKQVQQKKEPIQQQSTTTEEISRPQPSGELTDKMRLFVMEYLRDFNATRAAIAVGYSKKTAYSIGWELLRKPEVQAELSRLKKLMADELGLDIKRVIAEYMKIAFADITDYIEFKTDKVMVGIDEEDDEGRPIYERRQVIEMRPSSEVDGTVINEVSLSAKGTFSIKLHNKMAALEKLDRYLDYMTDAEKARHSKVKAETEALQAKAW